MAQFRNRGHPDEATTQRVGLRDLGPYLSQHRRGLVGVALCAVFGSLAGLAQPLLIRRVLAAVQDKKPVAAAIIAVVSLLLANAVVDGIRRYLLQRAAEGVVLTARRRLGGHLLRLPISEYDARRTGDLLSRIGADTTLLRAVVTGGLFEISSGVVLVIGATIAMALIDVELLVVTVVSVAIGLFLVSTVSRRVRDLTELSQARVADMTSAVERALSAVRTIRASGAAEREAAQVSTSAEAAYDAGLKAARLEALVAPGASLAVQGSFVLVLGLGGARVADGHLSVGNLIAFVLYLFLLVLPLGQGLQAYTTLQTGLGALQRIADGMALPQESAGDSEVRPGADVAAPLVEFVNVGFAYGNGRAVLHEVSFVVPRGARVALVGPSGGGKSTLLALVERFYDVTSGEVRFAGTDVRRWPRLALRVNMGYVEQEAPVLAGTIAANLRLAAPDADDAAVEAVVDAVALRPLVSRASHGLETEVGDGGVCSPAVNGNGSLSAGHCWPRRRCSSSMNPPAISTHAMSCCFGRPSMRLPGTARC